MSVLGMDEPAQKQRIRECGSNSVHREGWGKFKMAACTLGIKACVQNVKHA